MRVRNNEQDTKQKENESEWTESDQGSHSLRFRSWVWDTLEGLQGSSVRSPEILRQGFEGPGTFSGGPQGSLRVLGRILERPGTLARSHWGPRRLLSGSRNALQGPRETLGGPLGSPRSRWDSAGGVLGRSLAVTGLVWTAPRAISE